MSARLEDGALVVRIGPLRRALLVAGALGFVAVSALLVAFGSLLVQIVGALGVITFGRSWWSASCRSRAARRRSC